MEKYWEYVLRSLYSVQELGKPVTVEDLDAYRFDFGFSVTENQHEGKMGRVIGEFAYHIDYQTKKVIIWKLNFNP